MSCKKKESKMAGAAATNLSFILFLVTTIHYFVLPYDPYLFVVCRKMKIYKQSNMLMLLSHWIDIMLMVIV